MANSPAILEDGDDAVRLVGSRGVQSRARAAARCAAFHGSQRWCNGGSVRFTGASSRSVSFKQVFPRPLVIGYVGYDIPLLPDGKLGSYNSTLQTLTGKSRKTSGRLIPFEDYPHASTNSRAAGNWP